MSLKTVASIAGMAVIAAASFAYLDHIGLDTGALRHVRTAAMSVPDTNGLVVGSRVLLRGVAIGHVTGVGATPGQAEISWNYEDGYRIPADSRFRVDNLSALGEAYLSVLPATAAGPYLADGATVPAAHVVVPTTFQELSARLTRMLEQVEPDRIRDIFSTVDVALPDDPWVLDDLSRAGELLARTLTHRSGDLTRLLTALQPLLQRSGTVPGDLAGATPQLADFGSGFTDVLGGVHFAASFGPLTSIEDGAAPLIDQLQKFLDKSSGDLQTLGVDLLPGVRAGAAAMSTVDIGRFLDNALAATASGDAVTIHLRPPGR
ncbi:Mce family protein MceF [Nocardia nova SH22a]|uniref:Mce family protein MceF n=1 Tax=Nocardia nova SH22a TaxID=1415166 RepID=W5TL64_9NOCA|nr:MlaD family protein [Nocardia nova]AHH19869.1 Mce family protein MceF [Nocardia nova SH22a]